MSSEQQATARERIEREVFDSNSATLIYDVERGESPLMARPGYVTDRIIAIVREARVSETSIRWAASAMANRLADMTENDEADAAIGEAMTAEVLMAMGEAALQQPLEAAFPDTAE